MEIPFEVFTFITAFLFILPVIGFIFRFSIPLSIFFFASGILLISFFLMIDTIDMGKIPDTSVIAGSTTTYNFKSNPYDFTLEGSNYQIKVFLILTSVIMLFGGAVMEVKSKN
jgi:hypothetical protein